MRIEIAQFASAEAATTAIDELHRVFKTTFKRKPSVDLCVSTTFSTEPPPPRRKGVLYQPHHSDQPLMYTVTTRAEGVEQLWDARWLIEAAKVAATVVP